MLFLYSSRKRRPSDWSDQTAIVHFTRITKKRPHLTPMSPPSTLLSLFTAPSRLPRPPFAAPLRSLDSQFAGHLPPPSPLLSLLTAPPRIPHAGPNRMPAIPFAARPSAPASLPTLLRKRTGQQTGAGPSLKQGNYRQILKDLLDNSLISSC